MSCGTAYWSSLIGTPISSAPRRASRCGAPALRLENGIVGTLSKPGLPSEPKRSSLPPGVIWTWRRRPCVVSRVASIRSGARRRLVSLASSMALSCRSAAATLAFRTSESCSRPFGFGPAIWGTSGALIAFSMPSVLMSTELTRLRMPASAAPPISEHDDDRDQAAASRRRSGGRAACPSLARWWLG